MDNKAKPIAIPRPAQSTFYLCEKPSQARTLAKLLGAQIGPDGMHAGCNVVVGHAFGHLLNLAMPEEYVGSGKWSLHNLPILPPNWVWQVVERHRDHYDQIGRYLKMADAVVIATDPDEEGEVIARQILHGHGYTGPVSRLWASALDPASLKTALQNLLPLSATDACYHAGRIRHEMDWLFGMNLSRAFSVIFNRPTAIGRVKTRLLNELVKRDREIEQFVPVSYHTAHIDIGDTVLAWQPGRGAVHNEVGLPSLADVDSGVCLLSEIFRDQLPPPLPYTLSALLADASEMGMLLANAYAATQQLYESGAISYPRTGSTTLPGAHAGGFAAHHAIVNTKECCSDRMTDEAKQIFDLVQLNGVYQQLGPAIINVRRQLFDFGGELFCATDRWLVEPDSAGWLFCVRDRYDALVNNRKNSVFKAGDTVRATIRVERKESTPPDYFTEASLLRMMAETGMGTEATRVAAIGRLVQEQVAETVGQTDPHGMALKKPPVIRSTRLGREQIKNLPDAVRGPTMENRLQRALNAVRGGQSDASDHLLEASRWIARTIHGWH